MLTLKDDPENIEICKMVHGKRQVPVNWHPRRKKELRNAIENLQAFNTQEFRDRFELSRLQADEIFEALQHDRVCEHNQSKHFKCKDFIQERLISEMNIEDQPSAEFKIKFPPRTRVCLAPLNSRWNRVRKKFHCIADGIRQFEGT